MFFKIFFACLALPVILGGYFTILQGAEYYEAKNYFLNN
jgi:hypothetical protein